MFTQLNKQISWYIINNYQTLSLNLIHYTPKLKSKIK